MKVAMIFFMVVRWANLISVITQPAGWRTSWKTAVPLVLTGLPSAAVASTVCWQVAVAVGPLTSTLETSIDIFTSRAFSSARSASVTPVRTSPSACSLRPFSAAAYCSMTYFTRLVAATISGEFGFGAGGVALGPTGAAAGPSPEAPPARLVRPSPAALPGLAVPTPAPAARRAEAGWRAQPRPAVGPA